GHSLFLAVIMLASKMWCNDTYQNKLWDKASYQMFNLRLVNQIERQLCEDLDWKLNI
ncbi:hypothetical protein BDQ17DRAFT_1246453, partial [Cyathus striatus]